MVPAGGGGCVPRSMRQTAGVGTPSVDETVLVQCLNEISKAAAVHLQMAQKMQANVLKIMDELVDVRRKRQFGEEEPTLVDFLRNSSTTAQDAFDGTAQTLKPNAVLGTAMDTDTKPDVVWRQVLSSASIRTTTTHQSFQTSDEVNQTPKTIRAGDYCMTSDVSSDQVSPQGKAVPTATCMLSAASGEAKDDDDEDDSDDEDEDYEEEDEDEDKLEAGGEEEDVEGDEEEGDDDVEEEGETEDNGEGEDDDGEDEEDMDGDEDDPDDEPEDEEDEGDDGEDEDDEDDEDAEGESEEEVPEAEPPKKKRK